jgi:hypothetical protein
VLANSRARWAADISGAARATWPRPSRSPDLRHSDPDTTHRHPHGSPTARELYVNHEPVESAVLVDGDEIQIGKFRLMFLTRLTTG